MSKEDVTTLKTLYPAGTRVEVVEFHDPYVKLRPGTRGTVETVDDIGTIHVAWDNGPHLGLVFKEDSWKCLKKVRLGDETDALFPESPIQTTMNTFDELEYKCWNLFQSYCEQLGIELHSEGDEYDEYDNIDFCIAKGIQDYILDSLMHVGVQIVGEDGKPFSPSNNLLTEGTLFKDGDGTVFITVFNKDEGEMWAQLFPDNCGSWWPVSEFSDVKIIGKLIK